GRRPTARARGAGGRARRRTAAASARRHALEPRDHVVAQLGRTQDLGVIEEAEYEGAERGPVGHAQLEHDRPVALPLAHGLGADLPDGPSGLRSVDEQRRRDRFLVAHAPGRRLVAGDARFERAGRAQRLDTGVDAIEPELPDIVAVVISARYVPVPVAEREPVRV